MSALQNSKTMAFIAITDPARSKEFYQKILGLTYLADEPFALVFQTHDGIGLRLSKVNSFTPAPHTVFGWVVEDIQAEVKELATRGVVFERYDAFGPNKMGVSTFPNGDKVAWFKDPNGNILSITQFH